MQETPLISKELFCTQVIENQEAMFRTARAILRSDEDAEDAVQEAICAAFAHRGDLRSPEKFKPWILRILANKCYDACRGRRPTVDLTEVQDFLPAPSADPTERMTLWQAVLTLNEDLRCVVTLFYYEGFSIREISGILGIREAAVKTRLSRARARLRLLEDYAGRVFRTCAALEETTMETSKNSASHKKHTKRWMAWAAAAVAAFIAVPNISPTAAAAMSDVPVLGALVEIVTFREYTYDDGHSSADVSVPELSGGEAADQVNKEVQAYTDRLIAQFQQDCEETGEGYLGLDVSSEVVTNTDSWFTLRINATRTQASGADFIKIYHIDKTTDQVVTLGDLFQPDADYVSVLSDEVRRQMEERMAEDEAAGYFPDQFTAIAPDQNFYWNEDGDLVLVFDEYTIAAGFVGTPEFVIPQDVYASLVRS